MKKRLSKVKEKNPDKKRVSSYDTSRPETDTPQEIRESNESTAILKRQKKSSG